MKGKNMNEDGAENSHDCLDLSILRKPITTSINGFSEVRKAYDNGTDEIRQLLTNECDIVYECKVCRNIFRSLANFISHKRVYCRQKFNVSQHFHFPSNGFINQDISTIVQAEEEYTNYSVKDKPPEIVSKDLSSIIERLTAKKSADKMAKLTDFYDRVSHTLTQNDILRRDHTIQLERPATTSVAVYQTLQQSAEDNIKTEVEEVRDLLMDNEVVLGPDGKAIKTLDRPNLPVIYSLDDLDATLEQTFSCKICHLKFATEKMLKLHLEAKHIHSTYVYQCPACPQTFLVPAAVIRHLSNDHKKSLKRIRLMRDTIYKRRVRMDEVQVKGPSRELVRLQTDRERQEADNKAWVENVENYDASQSVCTYCGKSFERRAVLTTHLASCRQKQKSSTVTSAMVKKPEKPKKSIADTTKDIPTQADDNSNSFDSCTTNASAANKEIIQSNLHNKLNVSIDGEAIDSDNSTEKSDVVKESVMITPPANKRKRKRAPKAAEERERNRPESAAADEIYWSMDEGGELSVKKFAKEAENLPPPPPPPVSNSSSPNAKEKPEVKLPECDICCKTFVTKSNLKRHNVMFHYFKNRFLCKLCDFGANKKLELISHLGTKHNIMGDKHVVKEFITLAKEENRGVLQDESEDREMPPVIPIPIPAPTLSSASKSLPTSLCPSPLTIEPTEDSTSNSSSVPDGGSSGGPKKRGRPPGSRKIKTSPTSEMTNQKTGRNGKDDVKSPKEGKEKKTPAENIPKRPIRNRVKPVNKDFVYDLSHLLKKESEIFKGIFMEQNSMTKKKGKSSQFSNPPTPPVQSIISVEKPKPASPEIPPPTPPQSTPQATPIKDIKLEDHPLNPEMEYKIEGMKGAAFNMAKAEVALHTAALSIVPPLIVERPAMPGLFPIRSPEEDSTKVFPWIEKSSAIHKKAKRIPKQARRISDDILIKGARKQIRRRRKHSTPVLTVRSPLISPDHSDDITKPDSTTESKSRHTEKDFQDFVMANLKEFSSSDDPSHSIGSHSNPLNFMNTNGKRITMLQRLAENKNKRSDAVHRLTDPFGSDSSDEN
ncbi:hypothetical protein DMENIID0001_078490 [Sergentomyia squamirostris]